MCQSLVNSIPETSKINAIVILVLNILFPGIGTCIMACLNSCSFTNLAVGLLQILLSLFCIGWIWAIWWGVICLQKSRDNVIVLKAQSDGNNYDDYSETTKFLDQNNNLVIIMKNKKNLVI